MVQVDSEILKALGLDAKDASIASHGGSGFASTLKLSAVKDGKPIHYFIKTKSGNGAETMFKGTQANAVIFEPLLNHQANMHPSTPSTRRSPTSARNHTPKAPRLSRASTFSPPIFWTCEPPRRPGRGSRWLPN